MRRSIAPLESEAGPDPGAGVLERLRESDVYRRYRDAFQRATGLALWLEAPNFQGFGLCSWDNSVANPFCRHLNERDSTCAACLETHSQLHQPQPDESITITCFAGFRESAVPVRLGHTVIGRLRTGQVLAQTPTSGDVDAVFATLSDTAEFHDRDLAELRAKFFHTRVIPDPQYEGIIQLLVIFARQLSNDAERLAVPLPSELPEAVRRACQFLSRHFAEEHPLDAVARVAGVSPHYLCVIFKDTIGMTMTEFINRERIAQAKKRLLSRYARVSEVALDVGFGSLSQFNRCFTRFAGESPTEYRQRTHRADRADRLSLSSCLPRGPAASG